MGVTDAVGKLGNLAPSSLLEETALGTLTDMLGTHGAAGLQMSLNMVTKLGAGEALSQEEIRAIGLMTSSDLVAAMEQAEQTEKTAAVEFLTKVGRVLGPILAGLISTLI